MSRRERILIVDDEPGVRESVRVLLGSEAEVIFATSSEQAIEIVEREPPDLVFLDIIMPGMDGMECLERIRSLRPEVPVVMLTATKTVKTAVAAMKIGASHYLTKPFDPDELRLVAERELENARLRQRLSELQRDLEKREGVGSIIGQSPQMQKVLETIRTLSRLKTTVLITGESGTGKELVARALHAEGSRSEGPWVVLNCAAIPETLLESELFGHERGAFTDAHARRTGLFEQAHRGSIFLDEIGEMPVNLQAKLLRVLEEERFTRVGGTRPIDVDVRVIAATNRDLEEAISEGKFRADLYYRLNVVSLPLPPLRERPEDLPLLILHFLEEKAARHGLVSKQFTKAALDLMLAYSWPGNVRELENAIERAMVLSAERRELDVADLADRVRLPKGSHDSLEALVNEVLSGRRSLSDAVDAVEQAIIERGLDLAGRNQTRAAELLGTTRRILKYKIDKLGIRDDPGPTAKASGE